jgi:hypothetical protein
MVSRNRFNAFALAACVAACTAGPTELVLDDGDDGGASNESGAPDATTCNVGSERCSCTIGGGCDPALTCASGLCVRLGGSDANAVDVQQSDVNQSDADGGPTDAARSSDALGCSNSTQCGDSGLRGCCCTTTQQCTTPTLCTLEGTGYCL